MKTNLFCNYASLRNESDVEQFFLMPLILSLGFSENEICTKPTLDTIEIGKGKNRKKHIPDYLIKLSNLPVLIAEAKNPTEAVEEGIRDGQDYGAILNRKFIGRNPVKYVIASNGRKTAVCNVDEGKPLLTLDFTEFVEDGAKLIALRKLISRKALQTEARKRADESFEFRTPDLDELRGVLKQAHDMIRRKQKVGPKKAFYEFTKVLFVKLNEDKAIHAKKQRNEELLPDDFRFSVRYIKKMREQNYIDLLFAKYRDELETEVGKRSKKRIFKKDERITLSPSTIEAIVKMIENYDLRSVEDDINGKVFETFLEAAVRGKELGQFFTPRSVVKFMVELAELGIRYEPNKGYFPDKVLDGSCGTGGFLIFALSNLFEKAKAIPTDQEILKKAIREQSLFGIDASDDDIVPITRMNMYLHGDGGSHIFLADTLDKEVYIEPGLEAERSEELEELKRLIERVKFDVVLTNPPFSMKYDSDEPDEDRILEQYEISRLGGKKAASLKSNIMFIERYYDLLKEGGKLLTVIDESVLNTEGLGKKMCEFRTWLRSKFIIRAIVSLPKNTFVNAEAGVKTSVLYLLKRGNETEIQPKVFMAISEDVGHNDTGRKTSEWGDLGEVLSAFREFEKGKAK